MKKYLIILFTLIIAFVFTNVYAEDYTSVADTTSFNNAVANGGNIKLEGDITESINVVINNATKIDLNGHTISMGSHYIIVKSDLTILDSVGSGVIQNNADFVIEVGESNFASTGNLILQSGTIRGSDYGIYVYPGSYFQMDGGTVESSDFTIFNQSRFVLNNGTINSGDLAIQNYIDSAFEMNNGTVNSTGGFAAINFKGSCSGTINGGVVNAMYAKSATDGGSAIVAFKNTEVTINGGEFHSYAQTVAGNGAMSGNNEGTNAKFTITGGTFTAQIGACVYIPQVGGVTNISGGTFTSEDSAIEIRAGDLNITGGTFTGNREEYSSSPNHSGTTTIGAAVAVAQHNTKQPINVHITGGTFNAFIPISFTNPQNNPEEDINKVKIIIDDNGQIRFNSDDTAKDTVVVNDNKVIIESPEVINSIKNVTIQGENIIIHDLPEQPGYDAYIEVYDENDELLYRTTETTIPTNGKEIKIKVKYDLKANPQTAKKAMPFILIFVVSVATVIVKLKQRKLVAE